MSADVSIITSLYQAKAHLADYILRVQMVALQLKQARVALELVLVANDPSEWEQKILSDLARALETTKTATVIRLDVPREPLYASWNRGIEASSGQALAIWNVDDERTSAALIEGHRLISAGGAIVDFPFAGSRTIYVGPFTFHPRREFPPQYDPVNFRRKARTSPFFMFSRAVYDEVGPFDPHFRIAGDFDWCARPAALAAAYRKGEALSGTFFLHGDNLSGSQNPLEDVEDDIVMLRRGMWDQLVPANPDLLDEAWTEWGDRGEIEIPQEVQDRLWGVGARKRWMQWQRDQRRKAWMRRVRAVPRWIIDHTGLRPLLAKVGSVRG
jgi:hypothetical protein